MDQALSFKQNLQTAHSFVLCCMYHCMSGLPYLLISFLVDKPVLLLHCNYTTLFDSMFFNDIVCSSCNINYNYCNHGKLSIIIISAQDSPLQILK